MDESQRAMVAARLASLPRGVNQHSPNGECSVTQAEAATMLNVGKRSVERAREVIEQGAPELAAAVDAGQIAVSEAAKMAKAPKKTQRAMVAKAEKGMKPTEAARQVKAEEIEDRKLAAPTGKYRVIYADQLLT
jgi:hypothetical protein